MTEEKSIKAISANLFAIAMALMTVSPTLLKKFLYRIR